MSKLLSLSDVVAEAFKKGIGISFYPSEILFEDGIDDPDFIRYVKVEARDYTKGTFASASITENILVGAQVPDAVIANLVKSVLLRLEEIGAKK